MSYQVELKDSFGDVLADLIADDRGERLWRALGVDLIEYKDGHAGELQMDCIYAIQELENRPEHYEEVYGQWERFSVLDFLRRLEEACGDYPYSTVEVRY